MSTAVAVFSGGLDSTTMAYALKNDGYDLHLVSFNYGQRHWKELDFAGRTAQHLKAKWHLIDLATVGDSLAQSGSSLVDKSHSVPEGHYAADNMKSTVVPNRNMMMASIGASIAVANKAEILALGVHAGDHFVYPDCRPEFVQMLNRTVKIANEGFIDEGFKVIAPFLHMTKSEIAYQAHAMGVAFHETWSCYNGREYHCGKCGTCVERLEAINDAAKMLTLNREDIDLTVYEDDVFWKSVGA